MLAMKVRSRHEKAKALALVAAKFSML